MTEFASQSVGIDPLPDGGSLDDLAAACADLGIVTGKLFEAIALAPWVLVISPIDSDVRALTAGMPHVRHFHGGEVQAIADWLAEIAAVSPRRPSSECWQSFTWPLLGRRFATAVEAAAAQSPKLQGGVPA